MVSVSDFDAPTAAPVPPQNLEAEESVLGAAMLSPGAIAACREILRDDGHDFYRESHARIWRSVVALTDAGEAVDAITLTDRLEQTGELDDVGGRDRLSVLAALVPATANAGHYAGIVVENARLREFIYIGGNLSRLGWDRPGDIDELEQRAAGLFEQLFTRSSAAGLESETWAQFERSAAETIPMLIDGLWPENGLGFIAAPPKKGKTWIGLSLAVSIATGKPFLAAFQVTKPEPVVLLALEGHRAAIRGRIGCLAHGLGIDPHTDPLLRQNLHISYKPAGLNLADPAWIRTVRDLVNRAGARALVVDVLRAAAVLKENSNDEFRDLIRALQPLQNDGCALAMLHHFGKLTELSKDRSPGERMSGAGAMYGAFDVGIFITASEAAGRSLRLEFETRDVASPDTIGVHLAGEPTGTNGGFVFTDAATWEIQQPPDDSHLEGSAAQLIAWLEQQPDRRATTTEIAYGLNIGERTLARRRPGWVAAGVDYIPSRAGKPAVYFLPNLQDTVPPDADRQLTSVHQETLDMQGFPDESHPTGQYKTNDTVHQQKGAHLQEESSRTLPDSLKRETSAVSGRPRSDFDLEPDAA